MRTLHPDVLSALQATFDTLPIIGLILVFIGAFWTLFANGFSIKRIRKAQDTFGIYLAAGGAAICFIWLLVHFVTLIMS